MGRLSAKDSWIVTPAIPDHYVTSHSYVYGVPYGSLEHLLHADQSNAIHPLGFHIVNIY